MKKTIIFAFAVAVAFVSSLTSCLGDGDDTVIVEEGNTLGIPSDNEAQQNPTVTNPSDVLPNPAITVKTQEGIAYVSIDMTGVWDNINSEWLKLYGTGHPKQNVWVSLDGKPKGIDVYNVSDGQGSKAVMLDVVFLVDNSGSMSEESEAVANSIIAWSNLLSKSGLDVQVGCVGYGDSNYAIDGAFNMNNPDALSTWMTTNGYGTSRTHYFGGNDASQLKALAQSGQYNNGSYHECGMVALHFAHDNFKFRGGTNRIYVNFTDEPNQPYGNEKWSVEYLNPEKKNWQSNYGTVHSVFSDPSGENYCSWSNLYNERPWLMADYTGGTKLFTDRNFTDFTLENLPVTGAMSNSYIIRFTNIDEYLDGKPHNIKITVLTTDAHVAAEKTISVIFEV